MPDPEVVRLMRDFRNSLYTRETEQMKQMAQRWIKVEDSLQARFTDLADWVALQEGPLPYERIMQLDRYQLLAAQASEQVRQYNDWAEGQITDWRHESVKLASAKAAEAMNVIADEAGAAVRFSILNSRAVEAMIAFTQPKSPLGELLSKAFPDSMAAVADAMVANVALGKGPKVLAKALNESFGMGLNRSILIARTEQLRAARESSRLTYQDSGLIGGYQRICFHSPRTCPACLMAEGTFYPVEDYFIEHPQGRCILMPVLKGHGPYNFKTGKQWFLEQPEPVQKGILGIGRFDAWKEGQFELSQLVSVRKNSIWGDSMRTTSLRELTAGPESFVLQSKSMFGRSYSGMNLNELENAWYDLHDSTILSPEDKAKYAKQLRKAVRDKGGSVTNFTGRRAPGIQINRDWYKYKRMTMEELEQQWYLINSANTGLPDSEVKFLRDSIRKAVRVKGGSVTNFKSGLPGVQPAPKPIRVPKPKRPAPVTPEELLRARKYEVAKSYSGKWKKFIEEYADLEEAYSKGLIDRAEHYKQFNLLNEKLQRAQGRHRVSLPNIRLTAEEAKDFKFQAKTMEELVHEMKDRLGIEFRGSIPDRYLISQSKKLTHLVQEMEEAVRELEGILPGRFVTLEITDAPSLGDAIADADYVAHKIRAHFASSVWGDYSATKQMVTSNWVNHENSILHEIAHAFHFDNLSKGYPNRTTPPAGLSSSRYGQTNQFEFVAELFSGTFAGKNPTEAQMLYYDKVQGHPILRYFIERKFKKPQ